MDEALPLLTGKQVQRRSQSNERRFYGKASPISIKISQELDTDASTFLSLAGLASSRIGKGLRIRVKILILARIFLCLSF